jgi:hypothetical protein
VWRHLPLPHDYVAGNWPIVHIAVSRDGTQVCIERVSVLWSDCTTTQLAAAGRRGLALHNSITSRWKVRMHARTQCRANCDVSQLFGDERQERAMQCRALCWFGHDVVVVVAAAHVNGVRDESDSGVSRAESELRCYHRTALSDAACLHRSTLPGM